MNNFYRPAQTGRETIDFSLVAPDGQVFRGRNLSAFVLEHLHLFGGRSVERCYCALRDLRPGASRSKSWQGWRWASVVDALTDLRPDEIALLRQEAEVAPVPVRATRPVARQVTPRARVKSLPASRRKDGRGHWPPGKSRSTLTPTQRKRVIGRIQNGVRLLGLRGLAGKTGVSARQIGKILRGEQHPTKRVRDAVYQRNVI